MNKHRSASNERSFVAIKEYHNRILPSLVTPGTCPTPPGRVLADLVNLSDLDEPVSELSRKLFLRLRNCIGSSELKSNLLAIQYLACKGDVAGVRLLAAYLDVTTAGARLIPHLRRFTHTRRQLLVLNKLDGDLDDADREWCYGARRLAAACIAFPGLDEKISRSMDNPSPCLQAVLEKLLNEVVQKDGISQENRTLLVGLLRMETDAWQMRISRLAGAVDPFRISAVQRLLPMLARADANISELGQLIGWVQEGQDHHAFIRHGSRALEVLKLSEFENIYKTLKSNPELSQLAELHRGVNDNHSPLAWLGNAVARLLALDFQIVEGGYESSELDLMSAVVLVQKYARGSVLAIPLDLEQETIIQRILAAPENNHDDKFGRGTWITDGLRVEVGQLVLTLPHFNELTPWPHGLPCAEDTDHSRPLFDVVETSLEDDAEDENSQKSQVMDGTAIKNLVFSNITSTSVLLGFLRNPKVVAVPGLVAAVASRTRNPQVIETIASVRALHTGFANRDVPLICLRSPCNVSPKILRKFIHVKYVSKVDLRRMAADRSGIRKEVAREIEKYLEVLG